MSRFALVLIFALVSISFAATNEGLAPCRFLIGDWTALNDPGAINATGGTTFSYEIMGDAILRRNFAEFPAANHMPASRHEDLMVIYASPDKSFHADFYDSEGHHIVYNGQSAKPNEVDFTSEPQKDLPTFKLSYKQVSTDTLAGSFGMAPPGKTSNFNTMMSWRLVRKKDSSK